MDSFILLAVGFTMGFLVRSLHQRSLEHRRYLAAWNEVNSPNNLPTVRVTSVENIPLESPSSVPVPQPEDEQLAPDQRKPFRTMFDGYRPEERKKSRPIPPQGGSGTSPPKTEEQQRS